MRNLKVICNYILFGIAITGVNMASYIFLQDQCILDYKMAASLGWILLVAFALVTNKFFVFKSKGVSKLQIMRALFSLIVFRLLSIYVRFNSNGYMFLMY